MLKALTIALLLAPASSEPEIDVVTKKLVVDVVVHNPEISDAEKLHFDAEAQKEFIQLIDATLKHISQLQSQHRLVPVTQEDFNRLRDFCRSYGHSDSALTCKLAMALIAVQYLPVYKRDSAFAICSDISNGHPSSWQAAVAECLLFFLKAGEIDSLESLDEFLLRELRDKILAARDALLWAPEEAKKELEAMTPFILDPPGELSGDAAEIDAILADKVEVD